MVGITRSKVFFFWRSCGVDDCDGNYSLKNAQGSSRGRPRKLRGRLRKGMLVRYNEGSADRI